MTAVGDHLHMADSEPQTEPQIEPGGNHTESADLECCRAMLDAAATIGMLCLPENSYEKIIPQVIPMLGAAVRADAAGLGRVASGRTLCRGQNKFQTWTWGAPRHVKTRRER